MEDVICGPTKYSLRDSKAVLGHYSDGTLALMLIDPETEETNLTASTNMTRTHGTPPPDHVYIKNWSGNQGIVTALIRAKIIEPPETMVKSGFVLVPLCKLIGPILEQKALLQPEKELI